MQHEGVVSSYGRLVGAGGSARSESPWSPTGSPPDIYTDAKREIDRIGGIVVHDKQMDGWTPTKGVSTGPL
jgi:hypothetical protein|eukprot:7032127-Prymnesium_polylepis.1